MTWPAGWTVLPSLAPGSVTYAWAISADGEVAVGASTDADGNLHPVLWTYAGGIVDLGYLAGTDTSPHSVGEAYSVSADGLTVVGYCGVTNREAFRWTLAGGMVAIDLGQHGGVAFDVSDNGSVVVGLRIAAPFAWKSGTGIEFSAGPTGAGTSTSNIGVSPNGLIVALANQDPSGPLTNYWTWTLAGGWVDTGVLADFSNDTLPGGVIVANGGAAFETGQHNGTDAVIQGITPTSGYTTIRTPPVEAWGSTVVAATADQALLVGTDGLNAGGTTVWYWTATSGVVSIDNPPDYDNPQPSPNRRAVTASGSGFVGSLDDVATGALHGAVYMFPGAVAPAVEAIYPDPPVVYLSWSDDRGHSFGNPVGISLGAIGEYVTSLQWQRLGLGRSRVFQVEWSSPVRTVLLGAWIDRTPAQT